MNDRLPQECSGAASSRLLVYLSVFVILPGLLIADAPLWWNDRGVTNDSDANDYTAINQGQLKEIATMAYDEMTENLPGGVGDMTAPSGTNPGGTGYRLTALINSWSTSGSDGLRAETSGTNTNDYAIVNIGQVKAVAKPFYDRLIEVGYTTQYPWESSTNATNDYGVANIGQVKKVFSFDFSGYMPDWWQIEYSGTTGMNPSADDDGDGLTNLQEYKAGANPESADNPAVKLNVNVIVQ